MSFHCSEKEVISAAAFNLFELKCNKSKAIAKIFSLSEQRFEMFKKPHFNLYIVPITHEQVLRFTQQNH